MYACVCVCVLCSRLFIILYDLLCVHERVCMHACACCVFACSLFYITCCVYTNAGCVRVWACVCTCVHVGASFLTDLSNTL